MKQGQIKGPEEIQKYIDDHVTVTDIEKSWNSEARKEQRAELEEEKRRQYDKQDPVQEHGEEGVTEQSGLQLRGPEPDRQDAG